MAPMPAVAFRTFELSDPQYESEGLRHVTVHSAALRGRGDITFYVPPDLGRTQALPLAILLHGSYSSHWAWALKGGAHRIAARLIEGAAIPPMMLAMPSDGLAADTTAYLEHDDVDYASWIVHEVRAAAERVHAAVTAQSPQCITGLSMGGFGALYLGLRFPHQFAAVSAHSAVTDVARRAGTHIAGRPQVAKLQHDPTLTALHWARTHRRELPPFRFDCGTEDALCAENRALHRALQSERIPHTYEEFAGAHDWNYWQQHIEKSLRFFAQALRV